MLRNGRINGHALHWKVGRNSVQKNELKPTKANDALTPIISSQRVFCDPVLREHAFYADNDTLIFNMDVNDALELLALHEIVVNCVVTSPPFYGQRDYEVNGQIGLEEHPSEFVTKLVDGSRVVTFCFSDGSIDRVGDAINPFGWELSGFKANPVALWAHDSSSPPIGKVRRTYIAGQRLMGEIQFAGPETYAFADQIYRLVVDGFVRAVSVGFAPIEWKFSDDDDRQFGIDFLRQELLEISVVPVPANAHALIEAQAKSWGGRHPARLSPPLSTMSFAGDARTRRWHFARALRKGI